VRTVAVSLIAAALSLIPASPHSQELARQHSDGWIALFDGNSLTGWRGYRSSRVGAGWRAQDGILTRTRGDAGDLVTVAEFEDFELQLEWRITTGGNSGILYRVRLDASETYPTGPEYQILDNSTERQPKYTAAAIYDLVAPSEDRTRPVGDWNEARIVVRGWSIQHWLNGFKVVDIDLAGSDGMDLLKSSKFNQMPKFAKSLRGHIALQDHGSEVSFRNIRIRELK
jgi:hypothetical protein